MAVDTISGAVYNDAVTVQKPRTEMNVQAPAVVNLNVTEITVPAKSAGGSQNGPEQQDKGQNSVSDKQIKDAVSRANNQVKTFRRTSCEFTYHEETKRVSIKVVDADTKEVVREIPPEDTIKMLQKIWELAGLIVDEKR
ncbi:MAG TPA: flagellar protein FlaG [Mobilitalea sp.]|nr:flagellar protein FlaG [Mobilitalea sp.]